MQQFTSDTPKTQQLAERIRQMLGKAIVGQQTVIEQLLVAVLARGHVLMEGVPGVAKTLLVRALARCLDLDFGRVQLTPDLMPSDILGTYVFDFTTQEFHLRRGPIFTTLLLADEINRAPAKTQSALLEAMQERQVTIEGTTSQLDENFTVFATQNPIEYEGTYPLPEAQLDRFLVKVVVEYLSPEEEDELLARTDQGFDAQQLAEAGVEPVASAGDLAECRQEILGINVEDSLLHYIGELIRRTRDSGQLVLGPSPRAAMMLLQASKALSALRGSNFLTPDHIKSIAAPVLRHRLILRPEADIEGLTADDIIHNALASVPVPR